jgi:hypothetical protein
MKHVPILEWDALRTALDVHEPPTGVVPELFKILAGAGYTTAEIIDISLLMYSFADAIGMREGR